MRDDGADEVNDEPDAGRYAKRGEPNPGHQADRTSSLTGGENGKVPQRNADGLVDDFHDIRIATDLHDRRQDGYQSEEHRHDMVCSCHVIHSLRAVPWP